MYGHCHFTEETQYTRVVQLIARLILTANRSLAALNSGKQMIFLVTKRLSGLTFCKIIFRIDGQCRQSQWQPTILFQFILFWLFSEESNSISLRYHAFNFMHFPLDHPNRGCLYSYYAFTFVFCAHPRDFFFPKKTTHWVLSLCMAFITLQ